MPYAKLTNTNILKHNINANTTKNTNTTTTTNIYISILNFQKLSNIFWFIIFSMQKARLGCVVWVLHKSGGQKERQAPIFQVWISLYTALLQSRFSRLYFLPTNSCLQLAPNSKCIYNFNASEIRFDRIYKLVLGMPWGRRYESLTWTHVITPENAIYYMGKR